jgi:probable F420-dependent oxidoreductase
MEFQFHLWPQDRYASLDEVATVVRAGERLGYAAAASGEHILVPDGPESDVIGRSYYDPMVLFSYLAACTSQIRLQFCAMVIPYRHPGLSARGIASIDRASGGRFEVVVGSGWSPSEFEALGIPFARRGAITDEYVEVMRRLWTEKRPSYAGEFVQFQPSSLLPGCLQTPHVPLWIGGSGRAAIRRMSAYGAGWVPMGPSGDSLSGDIDVMRSAVRAAGRDPASLGFVQGLTYLDTDPYSRSATAELMHATARPAVMRSADEAIDHIASYAAAGVTRIQVGCRWETPLQYIEVLQRFSEEVMRHAREF